MTMTHTSTESGDVAASGRFASARHRIATAVLGVSAAVYAAAAPAPFVQGAYVARGRAEVIPPTAGAAPEVWSSSWTPHPMGALWGEGTWSLSSLTQPLSVVVMALVAVAAAFRLHRVHQRSIPSVLAAAGAVTMVAFSWQPWPGPNAEGLGMSMLQSFRHTPSLMVATAAAVTALAAAIVASVRSRES